MKLPEGTIIRKKQFIHIDEGRRCKMLFFSYVNNLNGKRKDRVKNIVLPPDIIQVTTGKRRASYAALNLNASLTLEAAFVMPLFIFAIIVLMFFLQAIQIQVRIQKALCNQTVKTAGYAYYINETGIPDIPENFLEAEFVKTCVIKELGENFFETAYIVNGKKGFTLNISNIADKGTIDVALQYYMKVPFDVFGIGKLPFVARARCRTWTGDGTVKETWNTQMVYVTAKGTVYHLQKECTYIKSDISSCEYKEIGNKRNSSGGIYYPCRQCSDTKITDSSKAYYTKYGTRYHLQYYCHNLQNNVFAISIDEAKKKYKSCSKCGNEVSEDD